MMLDHFDFNKIEDFDSHIHLSIPSYDQLFSLFLELVTIYSHNVTTVIDYGCSTGKFLSSLPKRNDCRYIGIDNSNLIPNSFSDNLIFIQEDATTETTTSQMLNNCVIVSMFFLQFLTPKKRAIMLSKFRQAVNNGGVLLIAEKVILDDPYLESIMGRLFLSEKRGKFTDTQILDKDKQLVYSMFCKTKQNLIQELNEIGSVTQVWQSYNFMGFVVR
jgi:trans-aconitate methyltransferase